jgi:hypothetical protein
MKKILLAASLIFTLALTLPCRAQTNTPAPPTGQGNTATPTIAQDLTNALALATGGLSNVWFVPYGLYSPGLAHKAGGGIGAFYPIDTYVLTGLRVDYVDGGFWMPSGNATFQLPIKLFSWLTWTPYGFAGVGIPLSGATVSSSIGTIQIPGHTPADNDGQPTAILGYGMTIHLWSSASGLSTIDLTADRETWTGFPKDQYRGGLAMKLAF